MKRVFGLYEAVFDIFYLVAALLTGIWLILAENGSEARILAGIMALVLCVGDAFHLLPRIAVICTGREEELRSYLGRGKQITSITMTVFYLLLWKVGLLYFKVQSLDNWTYLAYGLAFIRIVLCLAPQNRWKDRYPPLAWAICRNVPFFLLGLLTGGLYFVYRNAASETAWMWLAVLLSFACYFPVVLWANRYPKVGMLMLPKTCAYLWMLVICLQL